MSGAHAHSCLCFPFCKIFLRALVFHPVLWSRLISRRCVDYMPAAPPQPEYARRMWRTLQGTCQLCWCTWKRSDEVSLHQKCCSALGGPGQPVLINLSTVKYLKMMSWCGTFRSSCRVTELCHSIQETTWWCNSFLTRLEQTLICITVNSFCYPTICRCKTVYSVHGFKCPNHINWKSFF